ncbi:MAG: M28 family peptidase [bacterium]
MKRIAMAFLLIPAVIWASEYLIQIPLDIRDINGEDWLKPVSILLIGNNYIIARTDEENLSEIPIYTAIDENPQLKEYLSVYILTEKARLRIRGIGDFIFEDRDFVLLRKERDLPGLINMEGIEAIIPLSMEPVILGEVPRDIPKFKPNDVVSEMVSKIDEDRFKNSIQELQDFKTRFSPTPRYYDACQYMMGLYQSYGLNTYLDEFTIGTIDTPYTCYNVVAEKTGLNDPKRIFIVCGHLDSTSTPDPYQTAPGADDNGSGASLVLELARVMSTYNFKYTIRYINFGGEEQGLRGSEHYASECYNNKENIVGVINADMFLFAPGNFDIVWIPYNDNSKWLGEYYRGCANYYVPQLKVNAEYYPSYRSSDHASFWNYGFSAVSQRETNRSNTYYHTNNDTLDKYLQYFPFGTNIVRACVATLASLSEPLGGVGVNLEYFTARSDEDGVVLSWDITDKTRGAFNIYKLQEEYTTIGGLEYGYLNTKIEGVWVRLNDHPIEGKGPYIYIDTTAKEGAMSKYRLCAVEDGIESVLSTTSITYRYYEPLSIVSVYPMPCYKEATISVKGADENSISYRVYDISGRLVSEGSGEISDSRVSIKLPGLSNSVYLLEITSGDERAVARIVSMR